MTRAGEPSADRGRHALAVAAAATTFLLLTAGGFVTSLDAGLVFADWPLSDGSLNPEGWTRDPGKLSEHGHRILGACTGCLTLALALLLHAREPRRFVRVLGWTAVGAVSLQGLLGGLRVTETSAELALLHACTGQAFFGLMVALAVLTSKDAVTEPEPGPDARGLAVGAAAALFTIFMQVVLGAQLRHGHGPLQGHLLGAVLVAGTVLWLLAVAFVRHGGRPALTRPALLLAGLLLVQVGLGFGAAGALATGGAAVLLPSLHQATGALLLATSVVLCLRALRRVQPEAREALA